MPNPMYKIFNKDISIYGHLPEYSHAYKGNYERIGTNTITSWFSAVPFMNLRFKICLTKYNFLFLEEMVSACLKSKKIPENDCSAISTSVQFTDFINDNLFQNYMAFIAAMNENIKENDIVILNIDAELEGIFNDIQKKIHKLLWKDLFLHLKSIKGKMRKVGDELRVLGILLEKSLVGPGDLVLDLLHTCNADCEHCWIHSPNARRNLSSEFRREILSFANFKKIIADAVAIGTQHITLLADGEPSLHPDFLDMIKYIKKKNVFMQVATFTNGLAIDDHVARKMIAHGLNALFVSLPAGNARTYAEICKGVGVEGFKKVKNNLVRLHALKKKSGKKLPIVEMVFVLHNKNFRDILQMAEFAGEVGAEKMRFQLIHMDKDNRHLQLSPEQIEFLRDHLIQLEKEAKKHTIDLSYSLGFQLNNIDEKEGNWSKNVFLASGCFIGWAFSLIKANGDISLCCGMKVIDNMKNGRFREHWESEKYNNYRVAAKHLGRNPMVSFTGTSYHKGENGDVLFSEKCQRCDNHDINNYFIYLLEESGLSEHVHR